MRNQLEEDSVLSRIAEQQQPGENPLVDRTERWLARVGYVLIGALAGYLLWHFTLGPSAL